MNKLHQIIMVLVFATGCTNWSEHPEGIDHWTPEVHCADASIPYRYRPCPISHSYANYDTPDEDAGVVGFNEDDAGLDAK